MNDDKLPTAKTSIQIVDASDSRHPKHHARMTVDLNVHEVERLIRQALGNRIRQPRPRKEKKDAQ